jgi:hypothetical protein
VRKGVAVWRRSSSRWPALVAGSEMGLGERKKESWEEYNRTIFLCKRWQMRVILPQLHDEAQNIYL